MAPELHGTSRMRERSAEELTHLVDGHDPHCVYADRLPGGDLLHQVPGDGLAARNPEPDPKPGHAIGDRHGRAAAAPHHAALSVARADEVRPNSELHRLP